MSKNKTVNAANKPSEVEILIGMSKGEYLTTKQATELLGYAGADRGKAAGAWNAAKKTHPYLKDATVERTDMHPTVISREAVERYMSERGSTGGKSRNGLKWFSGQLTDTEAIEAGEILSAKFGREVVFEQPTVRAARIQAAKAALLSGANGQHDEAEADEADEAEAELNEA